MEATKFTSIQRAAAFAPIGAFPLDARCYFESYADALAAAALAEPVGSTGSVYYYGQLIYVLEDNIASYYVIQPDKSLTNLAQPDLDLIMQFLASEEDPTIGTLVMYLTTKVDSMLQYEPGDEKLAVFAGL